ncbi:EVE domain-containing protein [Pseudoalteromonas sp. SIMBA_153]
MAELPLVQKGSRLSVMPVTPEQWAVIVALL